MHRLCLILVACLSLACSDAWYNGHQWHGKHGNMWRMSQSVDDHVNNLLSRLGFYRGGYYNGGQSRSSSMEDDDGNWLYAYMFNRRPFRFRPNAVDIPTLAQQLGLTSLVSAVKTANLAETLSGPGPFTVFGPTNDAFSSLPDWVKEAVKNTTFLADVLKYHVLAKKVKSTDLSNDLVVPTVEGRSLRINLYKGNTVATAQCAPIDLSRVDQEASNGVIHVLKQVMLPPAGDIVKSLSECPVYKTLVKTVGVAQLAGALSSAGPFTVFAPDDTAFGKLPPDVLNKLIANPEKLAELLKYHVVSGTFCSAGLDSGSVPTLNGKDVAVSVSSAGVTVNGAKVTAPDASVTNGVVHGIDTVLIPPGFTL